MTVFNSCFKLKALQLCFVVLVLFLSISISGCGILFPQFSRTNNVGASAAKSAKQYLGAPYVYGGKTPRGFDCSGLTLFVYKKYGVNIPRTSYSQAKSGKSIRKRNLKPGDLVFFKTSGGSRVSHVGIYIGKDKFIHAPGTGRKVTVATLTNPYFKRTYSGARRMS